jgi:uncharacterized protein YfaS (alpha-2-macroglobulin family)
MGRFKGYWFGLADEQEARRPGSPLENLPLIGEDGKATFPVVVDQLPSTTRLINAGVTVRMREAAAARSNARSTSASSRRRHDRHQAGIRRRRCRRAARHLQA